MIIGLTGSKCAGKGTAAVYSKQRYGGIVYSMSTPLTDIARRLHMENTRVNLIAIVTGLRQQFGEDVLAKTLHEDVRADVPHLGIIDGIRMPSEVELFSTLPGFQLWYVDAPVEARYQRSLKRGEKVGESSMTFEQFNAEEEAVTEQQIRGLRERATVYIDNVNTMEEFMSRIDTLLSAAGIQPTTMNV